MRQDLITEIDEPRSREAGPCPGHRLVLASRLLILSQFSSPCQGQLLGCSLPLSRTGTPFSPCQTWGLCHGLSVWGIPRSSLSPTRYVCPSRTGPGHFLQEVWGMGFRSMKYGAGEARHPGACSAVWELYDCLLLGDI